MSKKEYYCSCNNLKCEGECREKHLKGGECEAAYEKEDK